MENESHYLKGKRWGFAVAKAQISSGKLGVHKADKAMHTCFKIARFGVKKCNQKVNQYERAVYRGAADGIYDAIKQSEKASVPKKKSSGSKKKYNEYKTSGLELLDANPR